MTNPYPHEIALSGVYFSPLLVAIILSIVATLITVYLLNRLRLSRFIVYPQFAFLAILTLYIILIDAVYIRI